MSHALGRAFVRGVARSNRTISYSVGWWDFVEPDQPAMVNRFSSNRFLGGRVMSRIKFHYIAAS
jgi:hypothetical protein